MKTVTEGTMVSILDGVPVRPRGGIDPENLGRCEELALAALGEETVYAVVSEDDISYCIEPAMPAVGMPMLVRSPDGEDSTRWVPVVGTLAVDGHLVLVGAWPESESGFRGFSFSASGSFLVEVVGDIFDMEVVGIGPRCAATYADFEEVTYDRSAALA